MFSLTRQGRKSCTSRFFLFVHLKSLHKEWLNHQSIVYAALLDLMSLFCFQDLSLPQVTEITCSSFKFSFDTFKFGSFFMFALKFTSYITTIPEKINIAACKYGFLIRFFPYFHFLELKKQNIKTIRCLLMDLLGFTSLFFTFAWLIVYMFTCDTQMCWGVFYGLGSHFLI